MSFCRLLCEVLTVAVAHVHLHDVHLDLTGRFAQLALVSVRLSVRAAHWRPATTRESVE